MENMREQPHYLSNIAHATIWRDSIRMLSFATLVTRVESSITEERVREGKKVHQDKQAT